MRLLLLLACLALFTCFSPGCGSDNPKESADPVVDELTGKTPIDQGKRMKRQIDGIRKMREDQAEEAAGGE